jgi:hypothetical protein
LKGECLLLILKFRNDLSVLGGQKGVLSSLLVEGTADALVGDDGLEDGGTRNLGYICMYYTHEATYFVFVF